LKAGADAKAKDDKGNTVLRYAQENNALAGTEIYQKLEDASKQSRLTDLGE
jgi:hypothetical protein